VSWDKNVFFQCSLFHQTRSASPEANYLGVTKPPVICYYETILEAASLRHNTDDAILLETASLRHNINDAVMLEAASFRHHKKFKWLKIAGCAWSGVNQYEASERNKIIF